MMRPTDAEVIEAWNSVAQRGMTLEQALIAFARLIEGKNGEAGKTNRR